MEEHDFARLQPWRPGKGSALGTFLGVVKSKVACKRRVMSLGARQPLTQSSPCRVLPAYARGRGEEGNTDAHARSQTLCLRPKPFHANMGRELPDKAVERVYARWFTY